MVLAVDIRLKWGVADAARLIAKHGFNLCRSAHQTMLDLARMQKLSHVEKPSGYFVSVLENSALPGRASWQQPDLSCSDRSDEFIERYLARQRERRQLAE